MLATFVVGLMMVSGGSAAATLDEIQASLQELAGQIDHIIGEAACDLTDQCRVIAVGKKPCGGPWSYRPYSVLNTDVSALEMIIERYYDLQDELNQRTPLFSDCSVVLRPAVQCLSGRCVAQ